MLLKCESSKYDFFLSELIVVLRKKVTFDSDKIELVNMMPEVCFSTHVNTPSMPKKKLCAS